jgi:NAD(P)H-hydrate epimerase
LQGDARLACEFARREGVVLQPFSAGAELRGVVVDALLGTGLAGPVRAEYGAAIAAVNASGLPVLAVDIPSGLCADTGAELGATVRADLTVTFIALKQGLLTGRGPALSGALRFAGLGVPEAIYATQRPASQRLCLHDLQARLGARPRDAHKGDCGHVLVVGGDYGYAGAALLAAEACARSGAGLTSVATHAEHIAAMVARRPELMVCPVTSGQTLAPLLARPSVLVVGPGLGRSPWSEQLLQQACRVDVPLVLDADGLNLLAEGRVIAPEPRANRVLTPHPGEAARLLGCTVAAVQADRFAAAAELQRRLGGVVVLKGAGTVIASAGRLSVAAVGNPGMASGGMGDVLSGIIGALLAQGLDLVSAAELGVMVHGSAADLAASDGERGLLATDLLPYVRELLNGVV